MEYFNLLIKLFVLCVGQHCQAFQYKDYLKEDTANGAAHDIESDLDLLSLGEAEKEWRSLLKIRINIRTIKFRKLQKFTKNIQCVSYIRIQVYFAIRIRNLKNALLPRVVDTAANAVPYSGNIYAQPQASSTSHVRVVTSSTGHAVSPIGHAVAPVYHMVPSSGHAVSQSGHVVAPAGQVLSMTQSAKMGYGYGFPAHHSGYGQQQGSIIIAQDRYMKAFSLDMQRMT